MPTVLQLIEREIRELVVRRVRERVSADAISREVNELLRRKNATYDLVNEMIASASERFDWIRDRTLPADDRESLVTILRSSAQQFAVIDGTISKSITDAVTRGIREGLPTSDIESLVAQSSAKAERFAKTITNTGLAAFDSADTFVQARKGGVDQFFLDGPSPERPWCRDHHKKIYTLAEIKSMKAGPSGMTRQHYRGGYNCRHYWTTYVT